MTRLLAAIIALVVLVLAPSALAQQTDPLRDAQGRPIPPKGVIEGILTRADNGEPIGRQYIRLQRANFSRSVSTDTFGRFRFERVPPGLDYQLSFYHNGYQTRAHGPVQVAEDVVQVEWTAQPVPQQVAPYTYSDTYLPGQNITVMVRSIRVTHVNVEVFRIPTALLEQRRGALIDRKNLEIDPAWKPRLTYRQPIAGGHELRWRTTRVEPAFSDPGFYIVRVSGAGTSKLMPIMVTRLSLITKRTPTDVWVWATDLESGKPLGRVAVVGENPAADQPAPPASLLKPTRTRRDGLARLTGRYTKNIRYWGTVGDSIAYVDTTPATAAQALTFRTYVYTDRPAYRPGDLVHYKVVVRANDGGAYRVVPGEAWDVEVRDPEGLVVYRGRHETNLFGTLHGELTLGESPALGTWTVSARSGNRVQSGRFKVLEYRKPEYQLNVSTSRQQFVQGESIEVTFQANYYFGAPLAGQKVTWTVYETAFRPWWYDSYHGAYEGGETRGYGQVARSGTVTLDARGRGIARVDVDRASIDRWVTVEAVVVDQTNREVSARHRVMVTRGNFRLGIRAAGKIFKLGEVAEFSIDATDFEGAPSQRELTVTASLEAFNTEHQIWIYETLDTRQITTGEDGKASYRFAVKQDGFIRVEVAGKDRFDHPIVQSSFIWATRNASIAGGYKRKSLDILPDKSTYTPGDTARVLVNTSRTDPWILFTVEGDGVFEPHVVKVDGNSRLFELPLTRAHAPNVYLSVAFAAARSFYSLQKSINVSPAHRLVSVDVVSDKRVYEPGEKARYTLQVKDPQGNPVEAELSVALVDEAVYSISPELAPDIGRFFYGHRPNPVRTAYSFPQRYLGGADKEGEDDAGGGVRRDFRDTAYWQAVVETDAQGQATVEIPLPDNLTTWRLTARAVTRDTLVGGATHEIRTAKDLIATLALPRFFRYGDHLEVVGMIHNRGEDLSGVVVTLEARGAARVDGPATQTFELKGGTSRAVRFPVDVGDAGGPASFTIGVKAGRLTDAEERTVPTWPLAVDRLAGVSGMASISTDQQFTIPEDVVRGTETLQLRLMPTLAGAVVESLEDLGAFPYGCVEQTMNAFLPDLVADKALKELNVPRSGKLAELPAMVRKGLRQLYQMQHSDGGWGWWIDDPSHPYMTAYALYGLARAKDLGWDVQASALQRGLAAAVRLYGATGDANTRAFIAYAVSHTPKSPVRDAFLLETLPELVATVRTMNPYSVATTVLAHVAQGQTEVANRLADELIARATVEGDLAWFPGRSWHYTWTDNDKESTAYALRALLATRPGHPIVRKSLTWLMARRRGGMWDTTKDTAAAVEALVALVQRSGELDANYRAHLLLNGTEIGKLDVRPGAVIHTGVEVSVPQGLLKVGQNDLAVRIDGHGTLYWSGQLRFGAKPEAYEAGLRVEREYHVVTRSVDERNRAVERFSPIHTAGVQVGDEVEVRVRVWAPRAYEYLALEDPLPAGWEVIPGGHGSGWSRREVRDEKVAFFATALAAGKLELTYRVRAEMAGSVVASPAVAWLMYMPQITGNSGKNELTTRRAEPAQ